MDALKTIGAITACVVIVPFAVALAFYVIGWWIRIVMLFLQFITDVL